jgi:hypothetical protein
MQQEIVASRGLRKWSLARTNRYSDHDHQLILVVDDMAKGRAFSEAWTREQALRVRARDQADTKARRFNKGDSPKESTA